MSYKPWLAISDGRFVYWSPTKPHLTGDDVLVPALLGRLDGSLVPVTATGPFVKADPADPVAALAVLRSMSKTVRVARRAPAVDAAPPGATA